MRLWARLGGIQKAMNTPENNHLIKLEKKLQAELETTLNQEEILRFQRSKEEWIGYRERNTKFYHAETKIRQYRKKLSL